MRRLSFVWLLFLTLLAPAAMANKQYVVLISLDGFRHDYVEKHNATEIGNIAQEGVRARKLVSVYPANTFPNHLSIITGLLPQHHGIVNNAFYDKKRPKDDTYARYGMGKGYSDSTWLKGMPLWNVVEFNGFKAATFFWPESDARINGTAPTYHYHYSKYSDYQQRIDQMIQWLELPDVSRPRFIAGYFSLTDSIGHEFGPDAPETRGAVQKMDALIGNFYRRLKALPIDVNLIIVSDHGMTQLDEATFVNVDDLAIPDDFVVEVEGAQTQIYAREGVKNAQIDALEEKLKRQANGRYQVMSDKRRQAVTMTDKSLSGDILLEVTPPARFKTEGGHISQGGHGYDPSLPDMGATFIASGPAFKKGKALPEMQNLEVFPGIVKLLGLEYAPNTDSNSDTFEQGLVENLHSF